MAEPVENDPNPPGKGKKAAPPQPLSKAFRARLLKALSAAAEAGDTGAAAALLELARKAEQDALFAQVLAELRAGQGEA